MKYMLLIHDEEAAWTKLTDADRLKLMGEYRQLVAELKGNGQYVTGSQLQPTSAATSVRVRNGKRTVTDGPFAETREQLGGYFLVDVANLDEALAIAARIPSARFGTVEVRPLVESAVPAAM
ncbi:MAG TPA: YciI family protein [Vicinamibacterales bacterium]|jgi:hypothetical protein|nr:YciI family protein [Vicinamibacterales bacterium]